MFVKQYPLNIVMVFLDSQQHLFNHLLQEFCSIQLTYFLNGMPGYS